MIQALVVEDEPPILRSICKRITNAHTFFQIAGTAYNGKEALEFLEQHPVDVVFTDISMPVMDGIDLIKHISEHHPGIATVLISGYQDFSYAKSAIKYGVTDYLLKPLDTTQLNTLLNKLYLEYCKKQENNAISFLYTNVDSKEDQSTVHTSLYMLLLNVGSFSLEPLENETQISDWWNELALNKLLHDTLPDNVFYWSFPGKNINENIIILNNPTSDILELLLASLKKTALKRIFPVHIILSKELTNMAQIKQKYNTLKQLLRNFSHFSFTELFQENDLAFASPDIKITNMDGTKLKLAFQKSDFNLAKSLLENSFKKFEKMGLTQLHLEAYLRHILLLGNREGFLKISITDIESNIQILISNNALYSELFENFIQLLWICHTENDSVATGNTRVLIEKIEHYIQKHIAETINNQILSSHFGLTPSYLSRLFKDYKKLTLSEYITNLRMEHAKELLLSTPELLVKDIAQLVGYSDPLYFSRVFKKSVGIYPSDFQEQNLPK